MKNKNLSIWLLFLIVIGVILGFSTWHQWSDNQTTILDRMRPIPPDAECNHGGWIQGIAFSPINSDTIATASEGNKLKIWDINTPETPLMTKTGHTRHGGHTFIDYLAFSPKGEWIASKTYEKLDVWEMPTGKKLISAEIRSFTGAISPVSYRIATALNDVRLWDISTLNEISEMYVLPPKLGVQALTFAEAENIRHQNETVAHSYHNLVFSNDDKWLAASGNFHDRTRKKRIEGVKIWDLHNKQLVKIIERKKLVGTQYKKYNIGIDSVRFSPNNRYFSVTGKSGMTIWTLPEWHIYNEVLDQEISDVAFSPDSKTYAVTDGKTVTLWSVDNLELIALLKEKVSLSYADILTFSPDGNYLAAAGWSGIVWIWDVSELYEK